MYTEIFQVSVQAAVLSFDGAFNGMVIFTINWFHKSKFY